MNCTSDILIIGGGNAGCTAAKLLAQKYSVTVLEAGYDQSDDPDISIPSRSGSLVLNRTNRYFYPLGHAVSDDPGSFRRFPGVAGETAGGSSSINGMQLVRGTAPFYQDVAQTVGDVAWDAFNADRIYKKMETFNGVAGEYNPAYHGTSGPIDVRQSVINLQAAELFSSTVAAQEGVSGSIDYNDFATPVGAYQYWQVTQTPERTRESSFTAYLKENLVQSQTNPNLYRATDTCHLLQFLVRSRFQKLHFDKSGCKPRATAVTVSIDGVFHKFYAKKYVIFATGFQTSAFLQNSGIGDGVHLKSLGIKVVVDNPNVGQHMINHPIIAVTGTVPPGGVNPFTPLPPGYDTQGLYSGGAQLSDASGGRAFQMIGIASPNIGGVAPTAFTIASLILDAESSGEIKIIDRDPNRIPDFRFNYFDPLSGDIARGVDIYTRAYNVLIAMGLNVSSANPATDPAGVLLYVTTRFSQAYHWVGMNRMAISPDTGVVDSNGRVFGTKNLLVADISICPKNPLGNTQAIAYWIGNVLAEKLNRKAQKDSKACKCSSSKC